MKKILLSAVAFLAAMSLNAQVVVSLNADNALGLDADNGTSLAAGTVLWEGAEGTLSVGADDTYKPQSVKATVGTDALAGGLQGSNNPKDADGGTCSSTLNAPVSGAFFVFNAKQDGYLYVIHKASSNKAYTVFEEGTAIGYTFAAVADATTELGAVYQFTLEGEGEFNALTAPVEWAEREYLKAEKPDVYAAHLSVDADGKETWTAISKGGIGVIVFPVYADCQYIFNANGSKMTLGGIAFSESDNLTIKTTDDITIYGGSGETPGVEQETILWEGEAIATGWANQPGLLSDGGAELTAAGAAAGDIIRFYCSAPDDNWQCELTEGHWGGMITRWAAKDLGPNADGTAREYNIVDLSKGYIDLTLTEDMLTKATTVQYWGNVFLLNGDGGLTVTKLTLIKGNGETAIQSAKAQAKAGIRYNLAGQKVDGNYKGIVIENGKKFMIK